MGTLWEGNENKHGVLHGYLLHKCRLICLLTEAYKNQIILHCAKKNT